MTIKLTELIDNAFFEKLEPFFDKNKGNPECVNGKDVADMLEEEFDSVHAWFHMWGNFNYQTLNNGIISGYIGNGYHASSGEQGKDADITEVFIARTKQIIADKKIDCTDELETLIKILKSFTVNLETDDDYYITEPCESCDGDGYTSEMNDDGDEVEVHCNNCDEGDAEVINSYYGEPTRTCQKNLEKLEKDYVKADMEDTIILAVNSKLNLVKA